MIIEWLSSALSDFDEIIDYIAQDNPAAAVEQGNEIEQQIDGLLEHHQLGRTGRVKGTRELVIVRTPYVVAYRTQKSRIQILRILHGARQWPGKF